MCKNMLAILLAIRITIMLYSDTLSIVKTHATHIDSAIQFTKELKEHFVLKIHYFLLFLTFYKVLSSSIKFSPVFSFRLQNSCTAHV